MTKAQQLAGASFYGFNSFINCVTHLDQYARVSVKREVAVVEFSDGSIATCDGRMVKVGVRGIRSSDG
jgi:hypothetical protein